MYFAQHWSKILRCRHATLLCGHWTVSPSLTNLEILVELRPELALEAVAVEAEEALEAVAVAGLGVLDGERAELLVHLAVEVLAQEERPEAEHRVHLLGVADAQLLAL